MRICFIVGSFPSLSETFILDQMKGLADAGHEIFIYAGARSDEAVMHEDVVRCGFLNHTWFYQDKPRSWSVRVLKFFTAFPRAFCRAPLAVLRSLNAVRYGKEALSLNLFFRMDAFLDAREADVVFCPFGPNGLVGLQMKDLGALTGKLVVAFHASDITAYVRRHGRDVYKELFLRGDRFLPISVRARSVLLELGCPAEKMQVHAMGVDTDVFAFNLPGPRTGENFRILSVARLVEKKGIVHGLQAVARLKREGMHCLYTIVGDGPLRPDLQARAREFGIEREVNFAGGQDAGHVRVFLKETDVLLAPSIRGANGDEEGVPVVLMEAMASGVPVVTTSTGGVGELVVDGQNGFVVPEQDVQVLTDKLRQIYQDPSGLPSILRAARDTVEARHNIKILNPALEQCFQEVCRGGR